MARRLTDKPPELADYIIDYLNDLQIKEQIFRIGSEGFIKKGRGVVVVDLRRFNQHVVRFYYLSAGNSGSWQDADMAEICQRYDPEGGQGQGLGVSSPAHQGCDLGNEQLWAKRGGHHQIRAKP